MSLNKAKKIVVGVLVGVCWFYAFCFVANVLQGRCVFFWPVDLVVAFLLFCVGCAVAELSTKKDLPQKSDQEYPCDKCDSSLNVSSCTQIATGRCIWLDEYAELLERENKK